MKRAGDAKFLTQTCTWKTPSKQRPSNGIEMSLVILYFFSPHRPSQLVRGWGNDGYGHRQGRLDLDGDNLKWDLGGKCVQARWEEDK